MHLLEVAAQHVRGLSPSARTALPRGYVAVQSPQSSAETGGPLALGGLLAALLYPDGRGGDAAFAVPGAAQARVALTFVGGDGQTYRLVRQLGGAGALQRLDPSGAFAEITRDSQQLGQYLRAQAQLPPRSVFEGLFVFSPAQLPSRASGARSAASASGPEASGGGRAAARAEPLAEAGPVDAVEVAARIAALEKELEVSARIDRLQFRQDALVGETFELEERLKGVGAIRAALAEAEASFQAAPTAQTLGLPHDIEERIARYPAQVQRFEEAMARLEAEREEGLHAAELAAAAPEPFWRDAKFVGAAAVGVLCLAGGLFADGALRYLALLDIPAFGVAALVALKWVDDLRDSQQGERREGMRAARERKVREAFEAEARPVKEAMKRLSVEQPQEVLDLLTRRALYAARVEELKLELAAAEADPAYVEAARGLERLRREAEELGEQMQAMAGGYVRDPREIERELARAKESLIPRAQVPAAVEDSPASVEEGVAAYEDPAPKLLALAADAAYVEAAEVAAAVKGRAGQYLTALSDRRWSGLELDGRGRARLVGAEGAVEAGRAGAAELDLAYLALRLTLVEWLAKRVRMPLVISGAAGLPPPKHALLGKMLKQLSQSAGVQVLHVSPAQPCAELADSSVAL